MTPPAELVVLVDEGNNILGTMPKSEVHSANTPLHRAFSAFIFNADKKLLLQQRSHVKKTWPLAWSNSCCGHPGLDEPNIDAAKRRIKDELGMTVRWIEEASYYRYQFTKDGVMENEICPIHIGYTDDTPVINPDEVEAIEWIDWSDFLTEIKNNTDKYSPWCVEEAMILEKSGILNEKNLI
ncbi:isopentenyl-diphosphate Delta-isomerase [Candidatus Gracilibacteria bacterium]|nr:isopentenyl-diphosphate Delta-isomerase [Candidatus Gracilibacteria bacterium]